MGVWVYRTLAGEEKNPIWDLRKDNSADSCSAEYRSVLDGAAVALSKESMCVAGNLKIERSSAQVKETATTNQFTEEKAESEKQKNHSVSNEKRSDLPKLQITGLVSKEPDNDPSVLVDGFAHGMIIRPCRAVQQAFGADLEPEKFPEGVQGKTHKAGQAVGALVPFVGLVALTRTASSGLLAEGLPPLARVMGEQAGAGFLMGSLFTPTELKPGQTLLSARMEQGSQSAATFCTLTGTSASLNQNLPEFGNDKISAVARQVTISFVTGTLAGFIDPRGVTSLGASKEDGISKVMLFKGRSEKEDETQWLSRDWSSKLSNFQNRAP